MGHDPMAPPWTPTAPVKDQQTERKNPRQTETKESFEAARGNTIGSTEKAAFISATSRRIGEPSPAPAADHLTAPPPLPLPLPIDGPAVGRRRP
jgi:hypothetical protein